MKLDRTHGPAFLPLTEVVMLPEPLVFIARKAWTLADPFF